MEKKPFLFAVSGVKNSGKTTLITKLIGIFVKKGLKVATIKHDGHDFQPDVPGTDTFAHLMAGAYGTAVFSDTKFMVAKKQPEVTEKELQQQFPEADLILLEGFKYSDYPKMEIVRRGNSETSVCSRKNLVAILTDFNADFQPGADGDIPVLELNDAERIAEVILAYWYGQTSLSMVVLAGGLSSRMGRDKADLNYRGRTFLENQIEKGKRLGISDILVSGYRGTRCSLPVIPDRYEKKGPLGGLEACFRQAKGSRCLVISVDAPLVPAEELQKLILKAMESDSRAVILQHGEKQEPLIGVYDTSFADVMEKEIKEGKGAVFAVLRKAGYETYISGAAEEYFSNINDREEYEARIFT